MAGSARNIASVAGWARLLRRATYTAMQNGRVPIVLGGDHSLSIGSVSGVLQYCAETGRTPFVLVARCACGFQYAGDLALRQPARHVGRLAVRRARSCRSWTMRRARRWTRRTCISFGVRAIDRGERELLHARGVDVVDMRRLDEFGAAVLMRRIIEEVESRNGLLHVSLDVDFLDPQLAPASGTTVPGGATFREAHLIMEMLHDCGLVGSLDVVELNPFLDERGKSALLLVDLVASLFGRQVIARTTETAGA